MFPAKTGPENEEDAEDDPMSKDMKGISTLAPAFAGLGC